MVQFGKRSSQQRVRLATARFGAILSYMPVHFAQRGVKSIGSFTALLRLPSAAVSQSEDNPAAQEALLGCRHMRQSQTARPVIWARRGLRQGRLIQIVEAFCTGVSKSDPDACFTCTRGRPAMGRSTIAARPRLFQAGLLDRLASLGRACCPWAWLLCLCRAGVPGRPGESPLRRPRRPAFHRQYPPLKRDRLPNLFVRSERPFFFSSSLRLPLGSSNRPFTHSFYWALRLLQPFLTIAWLVSSCLPHSLTDPESESTHP